MESLDVITRDELVAMIPRMNVDKFRKSERRLGLFICRVEWSKRTIYYRRSEALQILQAMGFPIPRTRK